MGDNEDIGRSLDVLRMVWREGVDLRKWYDEDEERRPYNLFYADVMAWVERTKVVLGNVFYNKKFVDDYESALQRNAYDDQDAYLDPANCLSVTAEYIRTIGQLARRGFIKDPYSGIDNGDSPLCFIAMWFDKSMEDYYSYGIKPAVESLGFKAVRVDKIEHNDRIDNKIFEQIRRARFAVADFTGGREGVYYEAGFAAGQGIPVIHICRQDWFNRLHFDVGTINTIGYETVTELKEALVARVEKTIGRYARKVEREEQSEIPF